MPSSSKTNYLQLNYWSAGDKPKMADFNSDNQRLDNAFQSHIQNNAQHLTGNQSAWLAQPFVSGTYTGDGAASRSLSPGWHIRPAAASSAACAGGRAGAQAVLPPGPDEGPPPERFSAWRQTHACPSK